MTDEELTSSVKEFKTGILGRRRSTRMCFAVCAPLAAYLAFCGVECELMESEVVMGGEPWNHFWIRLADGRALDPTIEQFNRRRGPRFSPVYLGEPVREYHSEASVAAETLKVDETTETS